MSIAVENFAGSVGTGATTVSYTTSGPNRVVILAVLMTGGSAPSVATVSDTAGLTWARRSTQTNGPDGSSQYQTLEIWWAYAASAEAAQTITVSFSGSPATESMITYAVSGLLTPSSPWDINGSLPAKSHNTGASASPSVSGVSTTGGNGIVLGWYGSRDSGSNPETAGSGFTLIGNNNQEPGVGPDRSYLSAQYMLVAAPQSGVTVGAGPSNTPWLMTVDSLAGAAPPPPFATGRGVIVGW